jgi:hypothetical protein
MRGAWSASAGAKKHHPTAPARVQWSTGVLLPPGVVLGNGTKSPRWWW